ncbi:hypothetical protein C8J56DRAFT_1082262 [Mycena floridula]|nr:hypothetical protein C8J56DRAFT_1082262 [Mycena floridula]
MVKKMKEGNISVHRISPLHSLAFANTGFRDTMAALPSPINHLRYCPQSRRVYDTRITKLAINPSASYTRYRVLTFSILLPPPTIALSAWLCFLPSVLTAPFYALVCLGIDELAVYWAMAVVSPHQIVRAFLPGKYEARSSRSSVVHNLAFKSFSNLPTPWSQANKFNLVIGVPKCSSNYTRTFPCLVTFLLNCFCLIIALVFDGCWQPSLYLMMDRF